MSKILREIYLRNKVIDSLNKYTETIELAFKITINSEQDLQEINHKLQIDKNTLTHIIKEYLTNKKKYK